MSSCTSRHSSRTVPDNLSRAALFVLAGTAAACGDSKEELRDAAIQAVSAESATAAVVQTRPLSALWDIDRASERLVRAGVAPRRVTPSPDVPEFFATAISSAAFRIGRAGEVRVFIFADSAARGAATSPLNPSTGAPRGAPFSWGDRPLLVVGQNMAAVIISGDPALRERVQLALEAGLPMPAKDG